jgi:hypothetical protein
MALLRVSLTDLRVSSRDQGTQRWNREWPEDPPRNLEVNAMGLLVRPRTCVRGALTLILRFLSACVGRRRSLATPPGLPRERFAVPQ